MQDMSDDYERKYEYSYTAQGVQLSAFINTTPYYYPLMKPLSQAGFHTHEWYELFYVERGTLNCFFAEETVEVQAGEMLIVRPGISHYSLPKTEDTKEYAFPFSFKAEHSSDVLWVRFLDFSSYKFVPQDQECMALAVFLIKALQKEHELAVGNYLFALLTRVAYLNMEYAQGERNPSQDSNMGRICRIDRILQKYFNNSNLSMEFIAKELHISVRQLARIIKNHYGCTYREKVLTLRMQYAAKLLKKGTSVSQAAYEVGYLSVSAFHTAFVKYFNRTPSAFRQAKH